MVHLGLGTAHVLLLRIPCLSKVSQRSEGGAVTYVHNEACLLLLNRSLDVS
jgi:hypothetical protein